MKNITFLLFSIGLISSLIGKLYLEDRIANYQKTEQAIFDKQESQVNSYRYAETYIKAEKNKRINR